MTIRKFGLSLTLSLLPVAANAVVFVQEARQQSGYGPTREAFSLYYTGACAERIGAEVGYAGPASDEEALPDILQYARDSMPHLLAQCPLARTVYVTAAGKQSRSRRFYHFTMHRDDDWAPERVTLKRDISEALFDEGFLPAHGPLTPGLMAYVRYKNGRFDAIYGRDFEGRMVATTVEKNLRGGVEPPRLSHYTVRGHWYEPGDEKPSGHCSESREGYALWGSFSMTVYPYESDITLQRKRCAEHGEDAVSEKALLTRLLTRDFAGLDMEPFELSPALSEAFTSAGKFVAGVNQQEFVRTRQPLYDGAKLRLYAARPELCSSHRSFDAIYRVNSEHRDREFGGNYARYIGELLKQVARERCGDPLTASVNNYSLGDSDRWDHMSFQFRPIRPSPLGGDGAFLTQLDHSKSDRAEAHDKWLAANLLGPACTDGPFCALPGGRYLNAIYRGDLESIRQMDHLYLESLQSFLGGRIPTEAAQGPFAGLFGAVLKAEPVHLLRDAANKYLYSYAAWGEACLDAGAQPYTFVHVEPVVIETDMDGVTTRSGGERYEATYTLNPEFFALRDRIGSAFGAADSDNPWNRPAKSQVFLGIVEMKRALGCRSEEVKQFERQLLSMTNKILAEPGTIPPPTNARPPVVEKRVAAAFPAVPKAPAREAEKIPRSAPVELPSVATTVNVVTRKPEAKPKSGATARTAPASGASTGRAGSSPKSTGASAADRQQQMSRELQALQQDVMAEMNALNQGMQNAIRTASSGDERTRLMTEYQSKVSELQRRAQAGMQEIRKKYQ